MKKERYLEEAIDVTAVLAHYLLHVPLNATHHADYLLGVQAAAGYARVNRYSQVLSN